MKQLKILEFLNTTPLQLNSSNNSTSTCEEIIDLTSDNEENDKGKENQGYEPNKLPKERSHHRVRVAGLITHLSPIAGSSQAKCYNDDDEDVTGGSKQLNRHFKKEASEDTSDNENTADEHLIAENVIASETRELQLMRKHGIYSNDAICLSQMPAKGITRQILHDIEGKEHGISVDGEQKLLRLYGGSNRSDVAIASKKPGRRSSRLPSSRSSDTETDALYKKSQTEDNQWLVEKVISKRFSLDQGGTRKIQYLLKWAGWHYKSSSWEEHCQENNIDDLIGIYNKRLQWREAISQRVPANERLYYYNTYMSASMLKCHQWEDEMNAVIKKGKYPHATIYVENWIDDEARPKNFQFIIENTFTKAAEKLFTGIKKVMHCRCSQSGNKCGSAVDCCPENFQQKYCYMDDGRLNLRLARSDWILECTDACDCDITCPTRVVQRGRQIPVVIFRTLDRGWSIRTCAPIIRHTFVCEYIGDVLDADIAINSKKPSIYQFQVDGIRDSKNFKFIVDSLEKGNLSEARFINHSCNPNLIVHSVLADRLDVKYLRIAFFAKRDIKQGEELTLDYCAMDKFADEKGRRKAKCQCKSKKCKGEFYY